MPDYGHRLPSQQTPEALAQLALEDSVSNFILASDDPDVIERFAADTIPAVREHVVRARDWSASQCCAATQPDGAREASNPLRTAALRTAMRHVMTATSTIASGEPGRNLRAIEPSFSDKIAGQISRPGRNVCTRRVLLLRAAAHGWADWNSGARAILAR